MALIRKSVLETLVTTEVKSAPKVAASLLTPVDELAAGTSGLAELMQTQPERRQGAGLEIRSATVERGWVETRARFRGRGGAVLAAGDVAAVRWAVFGPLPSLQQLDRGTDTPRSFFGALSLVGWDADTVGWNFFHRYSGKAFERGGAEYVIEYEIVDRQARRTALRHRVSVHSTIMREPTRF